MNIQKRKSLVIWLSAIFGGIILLIGICAIVLSNRFKPILREKIETAVNTGSNHLYTIQFKNLSTNLLTGTLVLTDVRLIPDTAVYSRLNKTGLAPTNTIDLQLKKLEISGLQVLKAYFKKQLNIKTILLQEPTIQLIAHNVNQKPDSTQNNQSLYQRISKTFQSIGVNQVKISDAHIHYINKKTANPVKKSVRHVNINIQNFLLDSLSETDTTRFYYTKDIAFKIVGYRAPTKDKMYTLTVDTIRGNITQHTLQLSGLKLSPHYAKLAFARKYSVQKDRYDFHFQKIALSGVDYVELSADQKLKVKAIRIGPAKVDVFMSRESPAPANLDKARNFPHVALRRLPIPTIVDSVILRQIDVSYSEYNPASKKIGEVQFESLRGTILNVTNDSTKLVQNRYAKAYLSTALMGTASLELNINFNLIDINGAFSYNGKMNNFNLTQLNPLSRALGLVEIEGGRIHHIDFNASGNRFGARGKLNMLYSNLKVNLLSDNIDGKGTEKKGLLSFLANKLLIIDENPKENKPTRTANMQTQRIPSASFFNLLWKTVFVGIKEIVGLEAIPEKDPVKQQKEVAKKIKKQQQKD
ncbi:hypothetical protein [Pedobacter sp. MW01-1-1]|uniref:hypothetical protein n=1 Tax=Pedobacter sp. MW01-1-1 TaxID=3383027 RepID=UPI003FEDF89F